MNPNDLLSFNRASNIPKVKSSSVKGGVTGNAIWNDPNSGLLEKLARSGVAAIGGLTSPFSKSVAQNFYEMANPSIDVDGQGRTDGINLNGGINVTGVNTGKDFSIPELRRTTGNNTFSEDDAQLEAFRNQQNMRSNRAKQVKDNILARGGEIDTILNDIESRIDSLLIDRKKKRQGQLDSDSAALIDALNASIPEIQKAFASLGLSSSTFVGDRVDDTNKEYEKSQKSVKDSYENDLETYGSWSESEKGNARANAQKARNSLDYVRNADATADNLNNLEESELTFNNSLTDFGNARNQYTTSGDALKRLESIGSDYDFNKIMDSFGALASSSANTGVGSGSSKLVEDTIRGLKPKDKKKLTEVEINNPINVATA